ncbi:MMPL family transporter [Streptomyces sp. CB03238]|uniref:MMPL family transporter n=1 Tax=Streptomyces sp. CB03238 TaxID=1907777 RepID=UPI0015C49FEC|nr:MMPL family transporter [Streptomyces sp. CB03238]
MPTTTEPTPKPPLSGDRVAVGSPVPFAVRHRRLVSVLALVLMALSGLVGRDVADRLSSGGIVPPGAESLRAEEILRRDFRAGRPDLVLLARTEAPGRRGVDAPAAVTAARLVERRLAADPGVARIQSYWTPGGTPGREAGRENSRQPGPATGRETGPEADAATGPVTGPTTSPTTGPAAALRARDGRGALVLAWLRGGDRERGRTAERVVPEVTGRFGPLEVTAGGEAATRVEVARQASRDARVSELVALPVTATLLLLVFGSLVAAALPVLVGVFAALGTTALLRRLTDVTEISVYALNIGTALAFALAIDYSLFLVSRYREERANGAVTAQALHTALRTAGRAVAFSAATVACSMAALLVFPHPLLRSLGYAGVAVTVMAAVGSLVVLPAVLALLGDRLERLDVFARWRRRSPADRATAAATGGWGRIALAVMRRPLATGIPVTCLLVLLAVPFTDVRFAMSDDRVLPAGTAAGGVGAALRQDFPDSPVGATGIALPGLDARSRAVELDRYARRVSAVDGVARVDTATGTYRQGRLVARPSSSSSGRFGSPRGAYLSVATVGEPGDPATADRVEAIRDVPAPTRAWVGGFGAKVADVRGAIGERLGLALTLVGASMFALVLGLTRRPVLAVKALVLNTLSLCATFGALVFLFQQGHLRWLVGDFVATGSLDVQLPVVTFCVAFGLSMDYECMLLSRMVEEHRAGADTVTAVARGLDRTARLFTWSALILAVVMVALATSGLVFLKAVGVGLALAAILDATVVRGLLVPAVMRLAGRANWWSPSWLRGKGAQGGPLVR